MKTLCVILARAGSKGLPDKNIKLLHGKPLTAWTIEHALAARRVDRVVLSTDGPRIAAIGKAYGVEVIDRPAALAGDASSVADAVRHAVETVETDQDCRFDAAVVLYGNVPLRPDGLVDRAIEQLTATGASSVQSVCAVGKFHPYWMKTLGGADGDALIAYQPNRVDRRQDLPAAYQLDGGVIVVRRDNIFIGQDRGPHTFLGLDQRAMVTEPGQVVDIDSAPDLAVAEAMMASIVSQGDGAHGQTIDVAGRSVGRGAPTYIIAELGVNHDGEVDRAIELTRLAKEAGADAVKVQLFDSQMLLSDEAELARYQEEGADDVREMLSGLQLTLGDMLRVRDEAKRLGMGFIATCFSVDLVEAMRGLDVDAVKVASPDAVNTPLIEALLALDRPMLISTGACDLAELEVTAGLCVGRPWVALQCVSAYPAPEGRAAIRGIEALRTLSPLVGYSDHTTLLETGMMAVAAGACVIEKHLTHGRQAKGPDHAASFDPDAFKRYVDLIRLADRQLGEPVKRVLDCEQEVRRVSRQSVCATRDLAIGEVIGEGDVTIKRPGVGIPAARLTSVIGKTLKRVVKKNYLIREDDLEFDRFST